MNVNEKLGIAIAAAGAGSVTTAVVMKSLPRSKSTGSASKSSMQGRVQNMQFKTPSLNKHTVTREDLGQATWTLLHSMASTYPDNPTWQQKKDVKIFIDSLSRIYPCAVCAEHFRKNLKYSTPSLHPKLWNQLFHHVAVC